MIINSTKFRFTILGAGIIFVTLITIVPAAMSGEFTRAKAITIAIFFFVGVFIIILAQLGLFGNIAGAAPEGQFAKPLWARLECSADLNGIVTISKLLTEQTLFPCNANTESCSFTITDINNNFFHVAPHGIVWICDTTGNNCGSRQDFVGTQSLPDIKNGQAYKFGGINVLESGGFSNGKITQTYTPYKLFRFYGGAKDMVNSFDCSIQSEDLENIRSVDYKVPVLLRQGGVGQSWINYVDDWAYGPATNIYTYNGQQAYCNGAKLYSIVKLQMKNGNLVPLDPTYKSSLPSGDSISGMGSLITNVECCPQEPNCGSDFKYKPAGTGGVTTCFSDTQCYNAGGNVPTDITHYIKYQCISGSCQASSPITVDCTSNAGCVSPEICDLSTMNYGKCITQKSGEYCGDGICQSTENKDICSADCSEQCSWYQDKTPQTKDYGLFGWRHAFNNPKIVEPTCVFASWLSLIIAGVIFLIVAIIFAVVIVMTSPKKRKN